MTDISEEIIVAEAQVVAAQLVEWFRRRLLAAEDQRDAALVARIEAEDDRRAADHARSAAVDARVKAEDDRRVADEQRAESERRVIEVEQLLAASEELADQLQHALDTRIVVEQAKGFLVARHGVRPDAAFEAIKARARSTRTAVREVAAEVISGTTHLEP